MSYKIAVVLGTARSENVSSRVSTFINNSLKEREDVDVTFVDVTDHLFGKTVVGDDSIVSDWKQVVSENDGFVFVAPEYNHSYPGELKILIDSLYDEYKGKVAGVSGISMGPISGARSSELLKLLLHTVNFDIAHRTFDVGAVQNSFDENGVPVESEKESLEKHLNGLVDEIKEKIDLYK
jgi:NAD(P)H-dependent FMN reductase